MPGIRAAPTAPARLPAPRRLLLRRRPGNREPSAGGAGSPSGGARRALGRPGTPSCRGEARRHPPRAAAMPTTPPSRPPGGWRPLHAQEAGASQPEPEPEPEPGGWARAEEASGPVLWAPWARAAAAQGLGRPRGAALTMLTSDTMSMLAMSMFIPTQTGGPAGSARHGISRARAWECGGLRGGGEGAPRGGGAGAGPPPHPHRSPQRGGGGPRLPGPPRPPPVPRGARTPLTPEVGSQADVVAFQQLVHRLLHEGHVPGVVHAAGRGEKGARGAGSGGGQRAPASAPGRRARSPAAGGPYLCAQHTTATSTGAEKKPRSLLPAKPHIPPPRPGTGEGAPRRRRDPQPGLLLLLPPPPRWPGAEEGAGGGEHRGEERGAQGGGGRGGGRAGRGGAGCPGSCARPSRRALGWPRPWEPAKGGGAQGPRPASPAPSPGDRLAEAPPSPPRSAAAPREAPGCSPGGAPARDGPRALGRLRTQPTAPWGALLT